MKFLTYFMLAVSASAMVVEPQGKRVVDRDVERQVETPKARDLAFDVRHANAKVIDARKSKNGTAKVIETRKSKNGTAKVIDARKAKNGTAKATVRAAAKGKGKGKNNTATAAARRDGMANLF